MIKDFCKNIMGTVSFSGKFDGMRKPQDFCCYPMKETTQDVKVQSDTRIGSINLDTGRVLMTPAHKNGAYNHHLHEAAYVGKLSAEELFMLKAEILATASPRAGTSGIVFCDNSGAAGVFGAAPC